MTKGKAEFHFESLDARIAGKTDRTEKHGQELEQACTIGITADCQNKLLDVFAPGLRAAFYTSDKLEGGQKDLDLENEYLPTRRFQVVEKFPLKCEFKDHQVSIEPPGGKKPIVLGGCELKSFNVQLQEGGSVKVDFKVNCHPSNPIAGQLYGLNGCDVAVEIEPDMNVPVQADGLGDGDDDQAVRH